VTHDQGEALAVSDRIAVMNRGRIEQIGTPLEIYEQPASRFVADFIGAMNFLRGLTRTEASAGDRCEVETPHGNFSALAPRAVAAGREAVVAIRPEHLQLADTAPAPEAGLVFAARVVQHVYLGAHTEIHVRTQADEHCLLEVSVREAQRSFPVEEQVRLFAPAQHCQVFEISGSSGTS
jgi:ABC-type Fe3+/spermidine/putrescine transport system ATPase subunit